MALNLEADLPELFETMKEVIATVEGDFEKFAEKGNKSAGTRVRGSMQDVKKLADAIRKGVQKIKNEG